MSHTITDKQIREAVNELDLFDGIDPERDHGDADAIMDSLLPPAVREARDRAEKRAGGWWWA